jgi:tRNA(Ile2)-agmatinylcytidine synthase
VTIVAVDDTDSRTEGMCTTYLATLLAERLVADGHTVERRLLVRLNPAVEYKTRGNAALAIHTDAPPATAREIAVELIETYAVGEDSRTSPGLVVAPCGPDDVPAEVATFAREAVREIQTLDRALELAEKAGFETNGWAADSTDEAVVGRGRIGALAAVGAWTAFSEWTYELISYREFDRCGTPRAVDTESVFDAADWGYPEAWDTVDRDEGEAVCVPNAPGPILHGIRGDDPETVRGVAERIESEPVERTALFVTNQGTDVHLRDGVVELSEVSGAAPLDDGGAYRVNGTVISEPETRTGGHVFFTLGSTGGVSDSDADVTVECVAFEPTKRFRDRVRALRTGDELTVCGEFDDGTIKLEKFAVRGLTRTELVVPTCPDCGRSMKSAGRNQGYRCRDCGTNEPGKIEVSVERDLETSWYEVPPCARRHVGKPLVRGGFDAATHPER